MILTNLTETLLSASQAREEHFAIGRVGGSDFETLAFIRLLERSGNVLENLRLTLFSRGNHSVHVNRAMQLNGFFLSQKGGGRQAQISAYLEELERSVLDLSYLFYGNKSLVDFIEKRDLNYWAGGYLVSLVQGKTLINYSEVENMKAFLSSLGPLLQGKTVLVVSPFSRSVRFQYENHRTRLIRGASLPEFALKTLDSPVTYSSIFNRRSQSEDWMQVLQGLKDSMSELTWDWVILSCGSYANPLASHAAKLGRSAIYLGGMLNVMFNLRGDRYESLPYSRQVKPETSLDPLEARELERRRSSLFSTWRRNEALHAYIPTRKRGEQ